MSDGSIVSKMLGPFQKRMDSYVLENVSLEKRLNFRKVVRETNDLIYKWVFQGKSVKRIYEE